MLYKKSAQSIFCFFLVIVLLFAFQSSVSAHGGGKKYVKINSVYISENLISGTVSPTKFSIGMESTSLVYIVGKEIL